MWAAEVDYPGRTWQAAVRGIAHGDVSFVEDYSTSLPSWLILSVRINASTSGAIGGIDSRTTPALGDHTRLTCSAASCSGASLRLWQPRASRRARAHSIVARAARTEDRRSQAWQRS